MINMAVDFAALGDQAVAHAGALGDEMGSQAGVAAVDAPLGVVQVDGHGQGQQIHVGLPEAFDGAHVFPVALEIIGEHALLVVQHLGDDVLAEVVGAVGVFRVRHQILAQLLPRKDVHAHAGLVALGMGGLFLKFGNAVVLVGVHDAEAAGFVPRNLADGNGAVGVVLDVELQHLVIVHLVNVVAAEDQYVIRVELLDELDVLVDGVGRAGIPFAGLAGHIGGQHIDTAVSKVQIPRGAAADIGVQQKRTVLGQHAHHVDAAVGAVAQRKVDDAVFAAVGDRGLGHVGRQNAQTAALAACQQHGNALFLVLHGWDHSFKFIPGKLDIEAPKAMGGNRWRFKENAAGKP